jgi:hypothetical protein
MKTNDGTRPSDLALRPLRPLQHVNPGGGGHRNGIGYNVGVNLTNFVDIILKVIRFGWTVKFANDIRQLIWTVPNISHGQQSIKPRSKVIIRNPGPANSLAAQTTVGTL